MKAYGMTRDEFNDTDVAGCVSNGRATATYNLAGRNGETHSYHSLRKGKKAAKRRVLKRKARQEAKIEIREQL